ncbi:hypothetical protein ACFT54_10210 [Streptomyces cinereoruber]|uniref:hypothetical protein n=1 Tax=Streptomyces cinereoruber TaxID=67260 RepID=UPI00363C7CBC
MSGCGCGQPVIISGTQAPARVDVETVIMCDVLADGTVAGTALVEPVYDTNTGERIATRTVDPATGDLYTVQGTLQQCDPPPCLTCETLTLCDQVPDDSVRFLRTLCRNCQGQVVSTTDTTLDGTTAYVVQGTVASCDDEPGCASPTTPVTTVGLCLPDGTPIAVTVVRDCDGAVIQEGWINLSSGVFSAGAPPVGTTACGDSQSVQVSGTFCDIDDTTGDVLGLVLIEYSYAADGTIASVRLVDAVTGDTYTPTGTVTTCPVGVEQPEQDIVQLCDVATDGTTTPFIRDYRRDEVGAIAGHSDYTLGGAAYTPTGTVGTCGALSCETLPLCDSSPVPLVLGATSLDDPSPWRTLTCPSCAAADNSTLAGGLQALFDGGSVTFPLTPTSSATGSHHWAAGALTMSGCSCPDAEVTLSISADFLNNGPANQQGGGTGMFLYDGDTLVGSDGTLATAGTSDTLTVTGTVPLASIQAGNVVLLFQVEGGQQGSQKTWTVSGFGIEATTDCGQTFLRTVCRDETGTVVSQTDTLDGVTAYTPVGDVGQCQAATCTEDCRDCETLLLCDDGGNDPATIRTSGVPSGTLSNGVDWSARGTAPLPATYSNPDGAWWGIAVFPNSVFPNSTWTFARPVTVEFSVYIRHWAGGGALDNTAQLPAGLEPVSLPDGYAYDPGTGILTATGATGDDPCSYLTDPQVANSARFRTPNPVTSVTAQYRGARIANCGVFGNYKIGAFEVTPAGQFLRTICRACDGSVSSVLDTELDGKTAYMPLGAVGACQEPAPPCDTSVLSQCTYHLPDTNAGFDLVPASFPGCWLGTATNPSYRYGDRVTSWEGTYQSSTGTVSGLGFVAAGVPVNFSAFTPALPANPTQSPTDYVGTATVGGVTITLRALAGNGIMTSSTTQLMLNPGDRVGIEFSEPVELAVITSAFADPPTPHNERLCGVVAATVPWDAVKVADCEGVITTVDAATRQPLPATATVTCLDGCCQPVQVCIEQDPTQEIEFISNEARRNDNTVDPVWKWTTDLNAANPPWYDMYQRQYSAAWSVVDSDTARPAGWVSPHPDGTSAQSSPARPNEGPSLLNAHWYPRAFFDLPDNADPATIRVQATVFNADQIGRAFRLNTGAWQTLPATATHNGTTYTFGPDVIPGAQAGRNYLYLDVEETVGGGAGLMVHLKVFYDVVPEVRSWTRMVCCDDSVYYLDEDGTRQDTVPDGWHVAPCGGTSSSSSSDCRDCEQFVLCDTVSAVSTSFLRTVCRDCTGTVISVLDTALDGSTAYSVGGTVGVCATPPAECEAAAVQAFRLCDLNPDTPPGNDGLVCATPFLRHFVYACDGTSTFHDTEMDGITAYTPVQVVECGENPPSLREQVWNTVSIAQDPGNPLVFTYTVANSEDPSQTGTVRMTASEAFGGGCAGGTPTAPIWNAPVTFTFEPDAAVLAMADVLRVDAIDWDAFEDKVVTPAPNRVESDLGHVLNPGNRWHSNVNNNNGRFYFDGPPTSVTMFSRNDGGGLACTAPAFGFITLVPGPPCGAQPEVDHIVQPLCDVTAAGTTVPFLRHWTVNNSSGQLTAIQDTALNGTTAYTPTGAVTVCGQQPDVPVLTGVRRVTGSTTVQNLKAEFPGLQSVSLSVLAGNVNTAGSSGNSQAIPAGSSFTWSVADNDDSSLAAAAFAGATTAADYFLVWTYKATAAG